MRLIDADALNKELQKRIGSPTEDKLYEVNLCIIDAPTIDAIPVKWLEDKMLNSTREVSVAAWRVLNEWHPHDARTWQKEQEANDT